MGPKSFRGFQKMGPSWLLHVNLTWARDANKTCTWSPVNFKKHVTSISSKLEPAIWSRDTGQRIPCIDRCRVTITWMSKIKEVRYKPRVCCLSQTYLLKYGRHLAWLRRRCAYAPRSNAASHDNHEKINSWVFFIFLYGYGAPLGRRCSSIRWLMAIIISFQTSASRIIVLLKTPQKSFIEHGIIAHNPLWPSQIKL